MTIKEAHEKIDDMAAMLKKAFIEPCTCYQKPDDPCRYCNLMIKVDTIMESLPMFDK